MTDVERDPVVRRAIDELQKLPTADAAAIRRVVAAAASARLTPADDEPIVHAPRRVSMRAWTVAGIAAAAAFIGFGLSNMRQRSPEVSTVSAPASNLPTGLTAVANDAADVRAIPQQFVFHTAKARTVSLVGDFNKWDPSKTPMAREAGSDLWSITLPVIPGRHIYGYMVDDSIFVLDPRAPKARDRDLGVDGSVIIVGKP